MPRDVHIEILLVEDNPADARLLQELLYRSSTRARFSITHVETLSNALARLEQRAFDVVLLDLSLSDSLQIETLVSIVEAAPQAPIVVLTGVDDENLGISAVRQGAQDYLVKGQADGKSIIRSILYAVERKQIQEQLKDLNETLEERVEERTAMAQRRALQLGKLASQLSQAEQRERRRLARVLHDGLQQLLIAAKFRICQLQNGDLGTEANEAVRSVDDLLDQSLHASRDLTVELSPPILHEMGLVPGLEWLVRQMEVKHRLRVELDADPTAWPATEDLRVLLFESVRELLFNVVKHAGVSYARVQVMVHSDSEMKVVVEDYGAGFEVSKAQYDAGLDGGFGLFSIRERLEILDGRMEIYSSPNCGARVSLYAPIRRADSSHGPEEPAPYRYVPAPLPSSGDSDSQKLRVMIADDHKIVCQGLMLMLQQHSDIEVVGQAADGVAAIELVREIRPDVVLMDISMPRMNGVDATRRITQEFPGISVIGLSMHEEDQWAAAMQDAGASAYLTKGGPPDVLVETIRRCHRERVAA